MSLQTYHSKRNFQRTSEPRGSAERRTGFSFVVQKHAARSLHYDFRLELDGVLLSWAIPKGPSLDPTVKRLAMQTEDHPVEYRHFEGVIPEGEYGAGPVLIWDKGRWIPDGDPRADYERGRLTFVLEGDKLRGGWHLVRTAGRTKQRGWLLIKRNDAEAQPGSGSRLVDARPESAKSGRTLEGVGNALGRATKRLEFVAPQLATLVDAAPDGGDWLHEIKLDGYRLLARCDRGKVSVLTRRGNDWSARLPSVCKALAGLAVKRALVDGELVVLHEGKSSFQRLQNSLSEGRDAACVYYAFDLLHLDGRDLRAVALRERKALLRDVLERSELDREKVRFSDHVLGQGPAFFEHACELGVEGSVAKRADAAYTSGRTRSWLKIKCVKRQEFVVVGFTDPEGDRSHFGALLLALYAGDELRYAGRVGTGFSARSLAVLDRKLRALEQSHSPLKAALRGSQRAGVHWVAPQLVAEIQYSERTSDGLVRHASFQGLREDKRPREVHAENAAAAPSDVEVKLTHPDRVLYQAEGITKQQLAQYYQSVAAWMLPHVAGRPLMLLRCPEGTSQQCFVQKHPGPGAGRAIQRVPITEKRATREHMTVRDAQGLVELVQLGAVEIHVWGSRVSNLECPDQLVFDLDPDEGLAWASTLEAAKLLRQSLAAVDLPSFLKTTGGKGLHVVVPIQPRTPWDDAKAFCKTFVEIIARQQPDRYVTNIAKAKRHGRILLDYLRNGRGATAVAPYSSRARERATVALPIAWDELTRALRPDQFTVTSVPRRVAGSTDPWRGFFEQPPRLPKPEKRRTRNKR